MFTKQKDWFGQGIAVVRSSVLPVAVIELAQPLRLQAGIQDLAVVQLFHIRSILLHIRSVFLILLILRKKCSLHLHKMSNPDNGTGILEWHSSEMREGGVSDFWHVWKMLLPHGYLYGA